MKEFINAITRFDKELQKEIIRKLENKEELTSYEKQYLLEIQRFLEWRKNERNIKPVKYIKSKKI